jgi:chromosome partitioning protein
VGQIIACANQKGGVGKTTTVVNLATYLALAGDAVLVVDLDPQGNATSGFGLDRGDIVQSIYEALIEDVSVEEMVLPTAIAGLSIVPSSIALAGAEVELAPLPQRERRLSRILAEIRDDYDYVVLDCPPSLGLITVNALTAADAVIIPIQCEYYALEGLSQLIATINLVRNHLNPELAIKGVVLTMYDSRTNLSAEVNAEVRKHLGAAVFNTVVPRSVRLSEAPSYGLPIALYRPDSKGADAYALLAAEFRARDGRLATPSTAVASTAVNSPTTNSTTADPGPALRGIDTVASGGDAR